MPLLYLSDLNNQAIADGASVTASSEAAGYPVSNLLIGKPWRSTGAASEWIEFDKGSASAFTLATLIGHNVTSSGTITVKAGASANPSTFSQGMGWSEFTTFVLVASQNYRYIRITFADTTNANGFIEIRKVMLGAFVDLGISPRFGATIAPEFSTRRLESSYLVPSVEGFAERTTLSMEFSGLSSYQVTVLKALIRSLQKDVTPIFVIPTARRVNSVTVPSGFQVNEDDGYLARFVSSPQYTIDTLGNLDWLWRTQWQLTEDGIGNRVAL